MAVAMCLACEGVTVTAILSNLSATTLMSSPHFLLAPWRGNSAILGVPNALPSR
jgi:hypothetical protein